MNKLAILLIITAMALSGCVYGGEVTRQGAPPPGEYISLVQQAIDQYRSLTGVLPIKNKEMDTPIYEKYLIDFKKLKERNLISVIPTNAFENGGTAVYVLVNVETKPEVKLMDLAAYQSMVALQKDVDDYKQKHAGQLPLGGQAYPHWYWLDADKLGRKPVQVTSPYSRQMLNVVIHQSGVVAIDYGPDVAKAVSKLGGPPADPNADLRGLLVASGFYVPARTYEYRWTGGEPQLQEP